MNGKGLFKKAVAVGAGLTVGKYLGGLINAGFEGVAQGLLKFQAKNGDEQAQEICDKHGVEYDKPEKNDPPKVQMGFRCE